MIRRPTTEIDPLRSSQDSDQGKRNLRIAWVAVALIPIGFGAIQVIGPLIAEALGYDPAGFVPYWVGLVGWLATVPVFVLLPAAVAIRYGLRARRQGREAGYIAALIGGTIGGFFLFVFIASMIGHLLGIE